MQRTIEANRNRGDELPERRRKAVDAGEVTGRRMGVLKSSLDFTKFSYRWINDVEARFLAKTKEDDWDVVRNNGVKDDNADLGDAVSTVVGTKKDGSALRAYLCRKPLKWFQEDQDEKQAELDRQLSQLRRGISRDGDNMTDYTPSEGITIR